MSGGMVKGEMEAKRAKRAKEAKRLFFCSFCSLLPFLLPPQVS
jgi:hypothetical protein